MSDCQFYVLLQKLKCVTVREVAERLDISRKSARGRLERLAKIGAVEKRKIGRAVLYCLRGVPMVAGRARKMRARVAQVVELLARRGCAATSALARELGLSHTQAFYALRLLQARGCAVEAALGKVAVWCISRDAVAELLEELRGAVVRLVGQMRYVTPKRLYALIARDRKAQETFGRIISVKPSAATFSALKALLGAVYGDPIGRSVFYAAQPTASASIDVRGGDVQRDVQVAGEAANVSFHLPPEEARQLRRYAERRRTSVSAVVRHAIEQLLARYRT
jgi:Mn-dependent DtxR family transcriptional regulator